MQIVIDIPEEYRNYIKRNYNFKGKDDYNAVVMAIANGTPLDLEGLKSDMKALNCGYPYGLDYLLDCLKKRLGLTIIETESEDK